MVGGKIWSKTDDRYLQQNHTALDLFQLTDALPGRTENAVRCRMHYLELTILRKKSQHNRRPHAGPRGGYQGTPTRRPCLACRDTFDSWGPGNRRCLRCKAEDNYDPGIYVVAT